jgi:hypothetical protein
MRIRNAILVSALILNAATLSLAQTDGQKAVRQSDAPPVASTSATPVADSSIFAEGEPLPPAKPAAVGGCTTALAGSVWEGSAVWNDGDKYNKWVQFRSDGVMVYAYRGRIYSNGRWVQDGALISFDTNNHYADYSGTATLTSMTGSMKNVTGHSGTWRLKRDCS